MIVHRPSNQVPVHINHHIADMNLPSTARRFQAPTWLGWP